MYLPYFTRCGNKVFKDEEREQFTFWLSIDFFLSRVLLSLETLNHKHHGDVTRRGFLKYLFDPKLHTYQKYIFLKKLILQKS